MPRGPQGQRRPADVVGCAVKVMKIATGEIEEGLPKGRDNKVKAGRVRMDSITEEERSELARMAARTRWGE